VEAVAAAVIVAVAAATATVGRPNKHLIQTPSTRGGFLMRGADSTAEARRGETISNLTTGMGTDTLHRSLIENESIDAASQLAPDTGGENVR